MGAAMTVSAMPQAVMCAPGVPTTPMTLTRPGGSVRGARNVVHARSPKPSSTARATPA